MKYNKRGKLAAEAAIVIIATILAGIAYLWPLGGGTCTNVSAAENKYIMYKDLKGHSEELKGYISGLKSEIEEKNALLTDLDKELTDLEDQYARLLEERAGLTERINALKLRYHFLR